MVDFKTLPDHRGMIPMLVATYKKMLSSLRPGMLREQLKKDKGDMTRGIKVLILGSLVFALSMVIALLIMMGASMGPLDPAAVAFGLAYYMLFTMTVVPVMLVGIAVVGLAVTFKVSQFLGGKGDFASHFYHFAMICGGLAVVGGVMMIVPILNIWLLMMLGLYSFFLGYTAYKSVHKFGAFMAVVMSVLPLLITIGLVLLITAMSVMVTGMYGGALLN